MMLDYLLRLLGMFGMVTLPIIWLLLIICIGLEVWRLILIGVRRKALGTILLEQFKVMVQLRLPLQEFAGACRNDLWTPSALDVQEVEDGLRDGRLLGDALARVPLERTGWRRAFQIIGHFMPGPSTRLITPAEAETLRIGETSGNLERALRLVLQSRRETRLLTAPIYAAFIYPLALFLFASSVTLFIVGYVLPRFRRMFQEMDVALPQATQFFGKLAESGAFGRSLAAVILAVPLAIVVFVAYKRLRPMLREQTADGEFIRRLLSAPGYFLKIGHRQRIAEFCRELGMLLRIETPAPRALHAIAEGTMNPWFRDRISRAAEQCEKGVPLNKALDKVRADKRVGWFAMAQGSPEEIATGLFTVAEEQEGKVRMSLAVLSELLAPTLVLIIGGVVGFIMVALFIPIISLENRMGT